MGIPHKNKQESTWKSGPRHDKIYQIYYSNIHQ